ncbi:hypothetical protein Nepgr_026979 [Nepenthes gracilis]|uniref:Uncharacterized protein n=1 Tax=Nepenthes gracilis TaxID=150966 RepID=A0AAD3T9M6_NEPGR|nr:hypothetical protein Nepgr_026979 [Nepenthes gracilis]
MLANTQIPESSRVLSQIRLEERSGSISLEESTERRNPRYSRAEIRNSIQEGASRIVRFIGGSSWPATSYSRKRIELRIYLNSKRSANAARANPKESRVQGR